MKVKLKNAYVKSSKHEKGGQGSTHALRRRLPFSSVASHLPLKGVKVYLDLNNFRSSKSVEEDLIGLGGTIEKFLSKEINYLISSQDKARADKICSQDSAHNHGKNGSAGSLGVSTPSPGVSTPSPFNMGADGSPSVFSNKKKEQTSRGKAMFNLARVDVTRSVLDNAEKWGVKIVHIEGALKWIQREKEKALAVKGQAATTNRQNGRPKKNSTKKGKLLKSPSIKFESEGKGFRPHYLELGSWPHVNVDTPRGTCPFDGVCVKRGGRRAAIQVERLGAEEPQPASLQKETGDATTPKPTLPLPEGSRKTDSLGFGQIATLGQIKRLTEKRKQAEKKRGYCECCKVKYEDLQKHIRGDDHLRYVRDEMVNYNGLDKLIQKGPSAEEFLKSVMKKQNHACSLKAQKMKPSQKSPGSSEDELLLISPIRKKPTMRKLNTRTPQKPNHQAVNNHTSKYPVASEQKRTRKSTTKSALPVVGKETHQDKDKDVNKVTAMDKSCTENNTETKSARIQGRDAVLKPCSVSCEVLKLSPSKRTQGAYVVKDTIGNADLTVKVDNMGAEVERNQPVDVSGGNMPCSKTVNSPQEVPIICKAVTSGLREIPEGKRSKSLEKLSDPLPRRTRRLSLNKNEQTNSVMAETGFCSKVAKRTCKVSAKRNIAECTPEVCETEEGDLANSNRNAVVGSPDTPTRRSSSAAGRPRKKPRIFSSKNIRRCKNLARNRKWRTFQSVRHFKLPEKWRMLTNRSVSKLFTSEGDSEVFEGFTEDDIGMSEMRSDLSYVEVSDIGLEENSDIEWEIALPSCQMSTCEPLPSELRITMDHDQSKAKNGNSKFVKPVSCSAEQRNTGNPEFQFSPPLDKSDSLVGYDPGDDFQCTPDIKPVEYVFSSPISCSHSPLRKTLGKMTAEMKFLGTGDSRPQNRECMLSGSKSPLPSKADNFLEDLRKLDSDSSFIFSNPVDGSLITPVKTPSRGAVEASMGTASIAADEEIEFNFSSPQRLRTAFSPLKSSDFNERGELRSPVHEREPTRTKTGISKRLNLIESGDNTGRFQDKHANVVSGKANKTSASGKDAKVCVIDPLLRNESVVPEHLSPAKCHLLFSVGARIAANILKHSPKDWSKMHNGSLTTEQSTKCSSTPVKNTRLKGDDSFGKAMGLEGNLEKVLEGRVSKVSKEKTRRSPRPKKRLSLGDKGQKFASAAVRPKSLPIELKHISKLSTKEDDHHAKKLLKKDAETTDDKKPLHMYRFDYIKTAQRIPKTFSTEKRVKKPSAQKRKSVCERGREGENLPSKHQVSPGQTKTSNRSRKSSETIVTKLAPDGSDDLSDFQSPRFAEWKKRERLMKREEYQRRPRDQILHYSRTHLKKQQNLLTADGASANSNAAVSSTEVEGHKTSSSKGNSAQNHENRAVRRKGASPRKGASLYDFDSS